MNLAKRTILILLSTVVVLALASTQLTLFVVQPIGALPEGRTILIPRLKGGQFIDSPDAMCERIQGGVNLLCRGMVMGQVVKDTPILLRFPYSQTLYLMSTSGTTYDR
jgi:hypothetical protein